MPKPGCSGPVEMPQGIQGTSAVLQIRQRKSDAPTSCWKVCGHQVGNHKGLSLPESYKTYVNSGHISPLGNKCKDCSPQCLHVALG